jgi:hypothetical protein
MSERKFDWQEVVNLRPQGYLELNDGKTAIHGPIESVTIDNRTDYVLITLAWRASMPLSENGVPNGKWTKAENDTPITFPNLVIPFVIEETGGEKGPRIRFGLNILYLNPITGLDPSSVEGLRPENLVRTDKKWPPIDPGTTVLTMVPNLAKRKEWTKVAWESRQWGVTGTVLEHHDSHGLYYDVEHKDGSIGFYDPSEIQALVSNN